MVGQLGLRILRHDDVESQDDAVLLVSVGGLDYISAGDLSDSVLPDGYSVGLGLESEGLQGAYSIRLDRDSLLLGLDLYAELLFDRVDGGIVGVLHHDQWRSCDDSVAALAGDLHPCCGMELLHGIEPVARIAYLVQGLGLQDGPYLGHERLSAGSDGDRVPFLEGSGVEDHVQSLPQTALLLNLQDGPLSGSLPLLQLALQEALGQSDEDQEQIGYPFALLGAYRDEGYSLGEVVDPVVSVSGYPVLG